MINRQYIPLLLAENFLGVNSEDSDENILPGEWDDDSIDIYSDPQGALGSRPGFTALTTASIGTNIAWCGFYQFDKHSGGSTTSYYVGGGADGKIYNYASSAYSELYSGLTTDKDDDKRYAFFTLDNTVVICCDEDPPLVWTGTGSAATFATSVTADWGLEWQRYGWLHSVVDPRLIYYCTTLGDPDSAYTSFINFDDDPGALTGACKQGDDMLIGKEFALFRLQYRGTEPLFKKYRVPSKVGPINYWTMKELPDGNVMFLASDFNFYMAIGDTVMPVGDNIKKYIKAGVNSRLKYAVSGLLLGRNQYWCSFTKTSGATKNDRTVVMDWSRPYQSKWGKTRYPWFIYSIGANCFAEVTLSGKAWLYHGGYTGLMYKDDTGTNDNGAAFSNAYASKKISHGDPTLEKKYENINLALESKGDWDMSIQIVCDGNAATEKTITQSMLAGIGTQTLWDNFYWDTGYWASVSDIDITREIRRQGKVIQVRFGTTGTDEAWNMFHYSLLSRPLRRGIRNRES
jgi:hypothetical protein